MITFYLDLLQNTGDISCKIYVDDIFWKEIQIDKYKRKYRY